MQSSNQERPLLQYILEKSLSLVQLSHQLIAQTLQQPPFHLIRLQLDQPLHESHRLLSLPLLQLTIQNHLQRFHVLWVLLQHPGVHLYLILSRRIDLLLQRRRKIAPLGTIQRQSRPRTQSPEEDKRADKQDGGSAGDPSQEVRILTAEWAYLGCPGARNLGERWDEPIWG